MHSSGINNTRPSSLKSIGPKKSSLKKNPLIRPAEPRRVSFKETTEVFTDFIADSELHKMRDIKNQDEALFSHKHELTRPSSPTNIKKKHRYDMRSHHISRTGSSRIKDVIASTEAKKKKDI